VRITYGRSSVLLGRHCDTLCISGSGFIDGVIFAHNGPYGEYRSTQLQRVTSLRRRAQATVPHHVLDDGGRHRARGDRGGTCNAPVLVWKVRVGGLASAHLLLANNDTAHGRGMHVTECPLVCTCNYVCTLYKLLQCIMCVYQAVCGTAMNACGKFAFTKCGCHSPKLRGGTIDSSQRGA